MGSVPRQTGRRPRPASPAGLGSAAISPVEALPHHRAECGCVPGRCHKLPAPCRGDCLLLTQEPEPKASLHSGKPEMRLCH